MNELHLIDELGAKLIVDTDDNDDGELEVVRFFIEDGCVRTSLFINKGQARELADWIAKVLDSKI